MGNGPFKINQISLGLVVLTTIAIVWFELGMNNTLVITPAESFDVWATGDEENQGNSKADYKIDRAFNLHCLISSESTFDYPYCNFFFALTDDDSGVDLSRFETLEITVKHKSSQPDNLRLYLNHFYTDKKNGIYPYKLNLHRLNTIGSNQTFKIDLKDFNVPFWWVCQSETDNPETELTNVKHLLFTTGESRVGREIDIQVKKIEFKGKWFKKGILYQSLLYVWLIWIVSQLLFSFFNLQRTSARLRKRSKDLEKSNQALDLKSRLLEELATHDELTGLLNRHGLKQMLDEVLADYKNSNIPFSILLIDLDHFKQINDQLGHDRGDDVLKGLGHILNGRCRTSDIPARWGGEEFVVVCRGSSIKGAAILARSLLKEISRTNIIDERQVTCSIGVAAMEGEDVDQTFKRADQALYKAKEMGRNRVVEAE